ncbi:DUF2325 domain-containing protein [Roseicella frigidaeris]|uniref:DUF2325 domain-containing protein n=1 Tax=Roseicella frigidaeris TaxID=2230885 RepID=A0A327LUT3_9PROT|nr:DUF2325 domain-containing protein [Roseicella frigidaeris]RAI54570.1 hypothetical protein DOO78_26020 [Roseicella frigidaeris]
MAGIDHPSWTASTALANPQASWRPQGLHPMAPARPPAAQAAPARRARIWELSPNLHCSIIGTCLSTHDLRRLLRKLGLGTPEATDHALHGIGVSLASRQDAGGRLLNKALDERHRIALRRFAAAKDRAALHAAWREAVEAGEIPGAYWAVLTHPAADQPMVSEAFGEVHMLSHLVGAANRADIRRLALQEREIATLRETVARQQARLQADLTERDGRIRTLQNLLAERAAAPAAASPDEASELGRLVARLRLQLDREARRREALERRALAAEAALREERERRAARERELEVTLQEVAAAEAALPAEETEAEDVPQDAAAPCGTVLYVGGRSGQTALLRRAAARHGAALLHHDAEQGAALLPGLIGRADLVVFPVDCVSHDAALAVKRLCRQCGRPYHALRSTGVASLLHALERRRPAAG